MSPIRLGRRLLPAICAFLSLPAASSVWAQNTSQLSGYVYIDRNNDGLLAFSDQPQPEWVLPDVRIELYSINGMTASLLATTQTDAIGHYLFAGLAPGTYAVRQIQPVEYADGLDTLGTIRRIGGQANPPGSSAGTASNNAFTNIVLPAASRGDLYNFGERGMAPAFVSKRYLVNTAPPPTFAPPPIPEPAAGVLAALGSLALIALRRK